MGRGRQKAKHTKVARELKYFSPSTDLTALEREIGHPTDSDNNEPDYEDKWADLYGDDDAEDGDSADSGTDSGSSDAGSDGGSSSAD
jgi:hypothetical protein